MTGQGPEEIGAPHLTVDQVAAGELKTFEGATGVAWGDVEQCVDHATAAPLHVATGATGTGVERGRLIVGRPARCVDCPEIDALTTGERVEQLLGDAPPASLPPEAERERAIARTRAWLDEYHQPDVGPDFDLLSYIARGRAYAGWLVRLLEQVDR